MSENYESLKEKRIRRLKAEQVELLKSFGDTPVSLDTILGWAENNVTDFIYLNRTKIDDIKPTKVGHDKLGFTATIYRNSGDTEFDYFMNFCLGLYFINLNKDKSDKALTEYNKIKSDPEEVKKWHEKYESFCGWANSFFRRSTYYDEDDTKIYCLLEGKRVFFTRIDNFKVQYEIMDIHWELDEIMFD
jgi:hypothetical protein